MMGYQSPFFNPYGFMQQGQMPQAQPQIPQTQVVRVNGENGAKAFSIGANSSVLLLDETQPVVWLKVTDGASYATVTPYKITPLEKQDPYADNMAKIEERISKIEEKVFKTSPSKKIV